MAAPKDQKVQGFEETLRQVKGQPNSGHVHNWLTNPKNADALTFIRTWLRMKRDGESFWAATDIAAHLKQHFGMPQQFAARSIQTWLQRHEYLAVDPNAEIRS